MNYDITNVRHRDEEYGKDVKDLTINIKQEVKKEMKLLNLPSIIMLDVEIITYYIDLVFCSIKISYTFKLCFI